MATGMGLPVWDVVLGLAGILEYYHYICGGFMIMPLVLAGIRKTGKTVGRTGIQISKK